MNDAIGEGVCLISQMRPAKGEGTDEHFCEPQFSFLEMGELRPQLKFQWI